MRRAGRRFVLLIGLVVAGLSCSETAAAAYRSPLALTVAPDGKTLYAIDKTAGSVVVLDAETGKQVREISVAGEPIALILSADGKTLYVAQRTAGTVAVLDVAQGAITRQIEAGPWPVALTLAEKAGRLYTCNRGNHTVSAVDLAQGKVLKQVPVVRDPAAAALTPDGSRLVVANYMPQGAGTDVGLAAEVSILDTAAMEQVVRIKLPAGSTMASGVCISPDGKWGYVVHSIGRFNLPITQLERGWVHTYALSILDVPAGKLVTSLLLDDLTSGAADPWAVVRSGDGNRLWISHAGAHEISTVDIGRVHELLEGKVPQELAALKEGTRDNVWVRISKDRALAAQLANDLTALYLAGAIRRTGSGGWGPRGLALAPDGMRLYVANYFAGTVGVIDTGEGKLTRTIAVGQQPAPDAARRGEIYFHDANRCFQRWHSCASCHLDDARIDGLPWDFMRDGIGNGKDVISLVLTHQTSPHNRRATRADPRECMRTGVTGSHLVVPESADVDDLLAYVTSIKPEPNPELPRLAEAAKRGKILFEGKAACVLCHPAPYYTDRRMHNVGITTPGETDGRYDTPSLVEAYRTAPYFHDGRAATMREALTVHNSKGMHGNTKDLTSQEIDDLVAYVMSL